jgi:hypothetical protein
VGKLGGRERWRERERENRITSIFHVLIFLYALA